MEKDTIQEQNFLFSGKSIIAVPRHAGKVGHDPVFQRQLDIKKKVLIGATVLICF